MPATKSKSSNATKSDAPVAARAALDQGDTSPGLDEKAKEQEKLQAKQLREGKGAGHDQPDLIPDARAPVGVGGRGVQGGVVDNMTRRSAADVMQGHMCTIDRTHDGISDQARGLLPEHTDGYGVYLEPASTDENGYPVDAVVILRDSSAGARVTVPYDSLHPAPAGNRG